MIGPVAPRRILLTGAGGFVGGWVLRQLETLHTPEPEIFASGLKSEILSPAAKPVRLDITDRARGRCSHPSAEAKCSHSSRGRVKCERGARSPAASLGRQSLRHDESGGGRSEALPASSIHLRQHVRSLWRSAECSRCPPRRDGPARSLESLRRLESRRRPHGRPNGSGGVECDPGSALQPHGPRSNRKISSFRPSRRRSPASKSASRNL